MVRSQRISHFNCAHSFLFPTGDDTYLVPEDTRQEAPPSYASAQADAVPPYWETTVHAPFSPDSVGDMVIDSLPTGSLFSFCWNLLVSISFQFVGFLLTYLLHTSHAARLGSRAGLGVTLIQYGFALRSRLDSTDSTRNDGNDWNSVPNAGPGSGPHTTSNMTWSTPVANVTEGQTSIFGTDATTEWASFILMTVGEFFPFQHWISPGNLSSSRMVCIVDFSTRILACEALGTWNSRISA